MRRTVDPPAIQRWRSSAYRDPTAAHPLVDGPPLSIRWSNQMVRPTVGKTVGPSWQQAQRWNQAGSNDATTPLSSRRTTVGGKCGITANDGPTHPDHIKWPGGVVSFFFLHSYRGRFQSRLRVPLMYAVSLSVSLPKKDEPNVM